MQCLTWAFSKPRGSQQEPFTSPARWSRSCSQRLHAGHPWVPGLCRGEGNGTGGSRAKQGDTKNRKTQGRSWLPRHVFQEAECLRVCTARGFVAATLPAHGDCPRWPVPRAGSPAHLQLLQQHHIGDLLLVLLGLLGLPVLLLGRVAVHGTYFEEAIWEQREAHVKPQRFGTSVTQRPCGPLLPTQQHPPSPQPPRLLLGVQSGQVEGRATRW